MFTEGDFLGNKLQNIKGSICNIEHYALHDGPGIRTIVFIAGCPLKCIWCANPETQSRNPILMFYSSRCIGCGKCIDVCPKNANRFDDDKKIIIDREMCQNCGICTEVCSEGARFMSSKLITVGKLFEDIKRDFFFYYNTEGGVTLSGGEPLSQLKFIKALLKLCKLFHINTTIETCGYVSWDVFLSVLKYTDIVLFDIKHIDNVEHTRLTGKPNRLILDNLIKVANETNTDLIIRIPVIPGYNDSKDNIEAICRFIILNKLEIEGVELLPFHRLGSSKYNALNRDYTVSKLEPPSLKKMEEIYKIFKEFNIKVRRF